MLALVDAEYKFMWVVGAKGSLSDAQVFNNSELKETNEDGTITSGFTKITDV